MDLSRTNGSPEIWVAIDQCACKMSILSLNYKVTKVGLYQPGHSELKIFTRLNVTSLYQVCVKLQGN